MGKNKNNPTGMSVMLVSYFPFLVGNPLDMINVENPDDVLGIFKSLEDMPNATALACVWAMRDRQPDGSFTPAAVFLYEQADALRDHLVAWDESKPSEWFNLHLKSKNGKYVIAMIPNFEKSIERYRMHYQLRTGYPMMKDTKFTIAFRSPHFVSGSKNMFDGIKGKIKDTLEVGFLDVSHIDKNDMSKSLADLDDSKIKWLGHFKVRPNEPVKGYLDDILDDAKEPGGFTVHK